MLESGRRVKNYSKSEFLTKDTSDIISNSVMTKYSKYKSKIPNLNSKIINQKTDSGNKNPLYAGLVKVTP